MMTLRSSSWKSAATRSALGVEAPKEVPVHRNEVYEAIRRNQQSQTKAPAVEPDATSAAE